ncbi:MAG: nuclease-related domain-containing protein [Candidatus Onthovivens sp.]|nr:nuclease-related domain-containing protein [Bacilli bacterium]
MVISNLIKNIVLSSAISSNDLFIIIAVTFGILTLFVIIFLIVYPFAKRRYQFKNFKKIYYKKIRSIAEINDYYLINNLILRNNEQVICQIDHCLFGEKFIYVIKDRYYRGAIKGDKEDNIWIFYDKKGKTFEMENPMKVNELRVEKLSLMTQIDSSFFISIVVINDDAIVKNMENMSSNDSYIVSRKKLPKLIKSIESRDVKKIDEKQLNFAVQDISRLYGSQVEQDE